MKQVLGIGVTATTTTETVACVEAILTNTAGPYQLVVALPDENEPLANWLQERRVAVLRGSARGSAWMRNLVLNYILERTTANLALLLEANVQPVSVGWDGDWCKWIEQGGFLCYGGPASQTSGAIQPKTPSHLPLSGLTGFGVTREVLRAVGYFEPADESGHQFAARVRRYLSERWHPHDGFPSWRGGLVHGGEEPRRYHPYRATDRGGTNGEGAIRRAAWSDPEGIALLAREVGAAPCAPIYSHPLQPSKIEERERLVVPWATSDCERRWEGRAVSKPWQYRVSAVIPHLETPEQLRVCIDLLRLQSVPPYIMVMDTGSSEAVRQELETLRAADLEIHYIAAHAYQHSSEGVGVAQDLAFALCRSEYLFCTHADCFLRRRDYIEWLLTLCNSDTPAVGYQMSPRDWLTDQWRGMVSHTGTLLHMPTMHRLGVSWSFERAHHQFGIDRSQPAWPDTETCMNLVLKAAGVKPLLLGPEENYVRHVDENLDHCRSYAGAKVLGDRHYAKAQQWMTDALDQARQRIATWRQEPLPGGRTRHLVNPASHEVQPGSETAKYRVLVEPYCAGNGIEIGGGGDPIHQRAVRVDLDDRWGQLQGDVRQLPWLQDEVLDFVYASHVLEYFEDWAGVLQEWTRVIAPNGYLVLLLADRDRFAAAVAAGQPPNTEHRRLGGPGEVSTILRDAGEWEVLFDDLADQDGADYNVLFVGQKRKLKPLAR